MRLFLAAFFFSFCLVSPQPASAQNAAACVEVNTSFQNDSTRDRASYYRVRARSSCPSDLIIRIATDGPNGQRERDFYLRAGRQDSTTMLSRTGRFWIVSTREWRRR